MDLYAGSLYEAKTLADEQGRPFRAPHHTVGACALVGEVALAAGGILYLEEVERFDAQALRVALGVVRSMECMKHDHTPLVIVEPSGVLGAIICAGFGLRNLDTLRR